MKLLITFFSLLIIITTLNASAKENALRGAVLQKISQFIELKYHHQISPDKITMHHINLNDY